MSRRIRRSVADEAWLQQVNAALSALQSVYKNVSRQNGNTDRLIRQMRCLKQARSAWLSGDRSKARQLLAAGMNPDDGQPPADGEASTAASNGQAGEPSAAEPEAQKTAPERTQADGSSDLG